MRSRRIEFYRHGKLDKGALRAGDRYLISQDSEPVCEFEMTLDHDDYLDMVKALSYKSKQPARDAAIEALAAVVTAMLKSDALAPAPGAGPLQLDLVVNAAELGALQFEAALAADGQPLLARDDAPVTLTRRVRGAFAEQRLQWHARPRVLFAWASPPGAGADVPHAEHLGILRDALAPWIGPAPADEAKVLTVLEEATLDGLASALRQACEQGLPYSHVHLLAHGYPVGSGHRQYFGLALHDDNLELAVVKPDELVAAFAPLRHTAATVTLAACDSGNEANTLIAEKSIAHQLHVSGIPIVVASQFPLTMAGSGLLVSALYCGLLAGQDVRIALHKARVALRKNRDRTYHDWISLVCYASLPEGYADVLHDIRLQRTLAALKTAQAWSDDLVGRRVAESDPFQRVEHRLRHAIADLDACLAEPDSSQRRGVLDEHLGLLGSAEKRLSELYFHRAALCPGDDDSRPMRAALQRSMDRYLAAARRNLSQHWQAVQALSLEAALTGAISRPGLWHAAVEAALIAREDEADYWATGSLIELYLLARLAGQRSMLAEALAERKEMNRRLGRLPPRHDDRVFAPESTRRQLQRYVDWWTCEHGFFPGVSDLRFDAMKLQEDQRRQESDGPHPVPSLKERKT